ncbi:helix-turn-helix domain protein [Mycoplasma sp. CAG:776]|nr:helix-turn-helix domain protein [Mycoplasma sp. CAG:776]
MLKEYRKKKNISQEELERLTNIDRKTIFRIENDLNVPLLDTFAKMVIALELNDQEIAMEVKKIIQKNKNTSR